MLTTFSHVSSVFTIRQLSHFYVTQNIRLRSHYCKIPLSGVKVAILKQPQTLEPVAKIFESYGADVTIFCETSQPKRNVDLNWSNSDFVKAHVYGNHVAGEREVDLTVDGDLRLLRKVARRSDIFIDMLHSGRLEELGLNPNDALKLNSRLIFARFSNLNSDNGKHLLSDDEKDAEVTSQHAKLLTMLGRVDAFTKILLALFNRQRTGKGQVRFDVNNWQIT